MLWYALLGKALSLGAASMFDWQEDKTNPSQPPLVRGATVFEVKQFSDSKTSDF